MGCWGLSTVPASRRIQPLAQLEAHSSRIRADMRNKRDCGEPIWACRRAFMDVGTSLDLELLPWDCAQGLDDMLIAGLVVLLMILGMFLQALTSSPRADAECQLDTDAEVPTTPAQIEEDPQVLAA